MKFIENGKILNDKDFYRQPINFNYFLEVIENPHNNIPHFHKDGFPYYEGGAMGFGWCYYYFNDEEDLKKYREYLKKNSKLNIK